MNVRFTPSARSQFLRGLAYIKKDKLYAAIRFRQRAGKVLQRLEQHPESGRSIPEFPELSYREVIVPPYRFFYRIEGDCVWIAAVRHGAQLPAKPTR